jgi:hypothetical protein
MDKVEEFLQSSAVLFIGLIMVLLLSTKNTAEVIIHLNRDIYNLIINSDGAYEIKMISEPNIIEWATALSFAIIFEIIILIFAAKGNDKVAKQYAWASFCFHSFYYHRWEELFYLSSNSSFFLASVIIRDFLASEFLSGAISISIHHFAKSIKEKIEEKKLMRGIPSLRQMMSALEQQISRLHQLKSEKEQELSSTLKDISEQVKIISQRQHTLKSLDQQITDRQQTLLAFEEKVLDFEKRIETVKRSKNRLKVDASEEEKEILNQINP